MSEPSRPLRATVNCDMGSSVQGFSLYAIVCMTTMASIHLANIAYFSVMNKTVILAKANNVLVGFGRREMAIEPDKLASCFIYQDGFLNRHGLPLNHIKPHGALARAAVGVAKVFNGSAAIPDTGVAFMGLAGTAHQQAAEGLGVPFIAEWFADLDYSDAVGHRVKNLLYLHMVTTVSGRLLPIDQNVSEVSICCRSDTPGAVEIARVVKALVDQNNKAAGYA
ncbi:hypothetical protein V8E55_010530 [Tylopilus felleus]